MLEFHDEQVEGPPYAHTRGTNRSEWEPLHKHLNEVAKTAEAFTAAFAPAGWGNALGRCHDLGKASQAFQDYLNTSNPLEASDAGEDKPSSGRVDHSTFGARYACRTFGKVVRSMLAFCIAGHHAGLPDWSSTEDGSRAHLQARLDSANEIPYVPDPGLNLISPPLPKYTNTPALKFSLAFFTRMIFSALIDADRLCTEAFVDSEQTKEREIPRPSLASLQTALQASMKALQAGARDTPVNRQRRAVLEQCIAAAALAPGFFSLQVPTGGGKTLASLAFALEHALLKNRSRVIMAIPFTSIIEQTADVYRRALGDFAEHGLIEHHTNLVPERETRANKLGSENWDAPLVVTTNVQLFESLFAAKTTPCRKLHNIANSVIILDEAQTLPVELLEATLAALKELVQHFGCTVVLCTATQPALEQREGFPIGIEPDTVRSIIADPQPLFDALRRVVVQHVGPLTDAELVERLAAEPRVLCIVNTRAHAALLYYALSQGASDGTYFHLSTLMCGAHRRNVLDKIRERLKDHPNVECRVVSTQLVEAGVDLDFPVVYRSAAGLDSIAQAAGRCNREGSLQDGQLGRTYVFESPEHPLRGFLEQTRHAGVEILSLTEYQHDPLSPDAIRAYFQHLYWKKKAQWDDRGVMSCFALDGTTGDLRFQFRQAADAYQIIDDTQLPILVPYDKKSHEMREDLLSGHVEFVPQRYLQPYLVSVPSHAFARMESEHIVQQHASGVGLLLRNDVYDEHTGLKLEGFGLDARAWAV